MGFTSELSTNANPPDGLYAVLSGMTITPWPMLLQVMLFQPIALDEQAKDLLRAGQYEQALHLAGICAADGAPWAETAFAETALLLLHGRLPLEPSIKPTPPPFTLMCALSSFYTIFFLMYCSCSLTSTITQKLLTLVLCIIPPLRPVPPIATLLSHYSQLLLNQP